MEDIYFLEMTPLHQPSFPQQDSTLLLLLFLSGKIQERKREKKRNKKYVKRVDFNYISGWEMLDLHILWLKNK